MVTLSNIIRYIHHIVMPFLNILKIIILNYYCQLNSIALLELKGTDFLDDL